MNEMRVTVEKVVIFGTANCPNCTKARELAERYYEKVEYKDVTYTKYYEELLGYKVNMTIQPHIWFHIKRESARYIGTYADLKSYIISKNVPTD
jgi:glutaredoxin|tara:strand:+ start:170 stop:451 length:282 start_codon:yes stop_codon:yes gene_type:complete